MSKIIRVSEDIHSSLVALTAGDETFDDLLWRIVRERRDTIGEGAGM